MIRRAGGADAAPAATLLRASWCDNYGPLVGVAAVVETAGRVLAPERLAAEIADPARCVLVSERAGALAGVLFAEPGPATLTVSRLYVAPEAQRRGVGRALLGALDDAYPGCAVELEVAAPNAPAAAFYHRLGFRPVGQGTHHFGTAEMPTVRLRRPPGGLVIEPAVADDVPALVAIFAADAVGGHGDTTDPSALPAYRAAFAAIAADPGTALFVVRRDGRVVGTFQLLFARSLTGGGARRAILEAVQVAPELRGQGLGAAMVAHAEAVARGRGAVSLALTSNRARTDAHRFYARLGYAPSHLGFKKPL